MSSKHDVIVSTQAVDRRLTSHFSLTVHLMQARCERIPCSVSLVLVLVLVQLLLWQVRKIMSGIQTPPVGGRVGMKSDSDIRTFPDLSVWGKKKKKIQEEEVQLLVTPVPNARTSSCVSPFGFWLKVVHIFHMAFVSITCDRNNWVQTEHSACDIYF